MAKVELGYTDLHVFLKNLKMDDKKGLPHSERKIEKISMKRYNIPELLSDIYELKGGVKIGFADDGNLKITGGYQKAIVAKRNLDEFISNSELENDEIKMYKYLSSKLGEYIERLAKQKKNREEKKKEEQDKDKKTDQDKDKKTDQDKDKKTDQDKDTNPDEKGSNIMDLKDVNSLEDLKKQIEAFEAEQARINGKEKLDKIDEEISAIADEIRRKEYELEKYKAELANLDTRKMDYIESKIAVAELEGTIKLVHTGSTEKIKKEDGTVITVTKKGLDGLKEELEALKKQREDVENGKNEPNREKETAELRFQRSAFFTQAQTKFDNEIRKVKHEMEGILISLDEFHYEYKEGTRIPTNGAALRSLNDQYRGLQVRLADLQAAKALCDEQKKLIKAEYDKAVAGINEVISRKYKVEKVEEPKTTEEPKKVEEPKTTEESKKAEEPKTTEESKKAEEPKTTEEGKKVEEPKTTEEGKKAEETKREEVNEEELPMLREDYYAGLNFYDRYLMKKAAFMHERDGQINENSDISIFQKIRLMLPSPKFRAKAERGIKFRYLDPVKILGYDPYEEYEENDDVDYEPIDEREDGLDKYKTHTPDPRMNAGKGNRTRETDERDDRV